MNTGVADRGVLVCGTGLGMAIAADKVTGIRAVPVQTVQFAELCRQHNDANVICLSGRFVELEENQRILDTFLTTKFEGGRHALRVAKIMKLDNDPTRPTERTGEVLPVNPCHKIDFSGEASPLNN